MAYKSKDAVEAIKLKYKSSEDILQGSNQIDSSLVCLDVYESLLKLGKTNEMMDAYQRLDFTNNFEGAGDVFVDYHGAV